MRHEIAGLLILTGFFMIMMSFVHMPSQRDANYGGVILIGPIPLVFGSSPEMAIISILLALALTILSFLLFRGRF